MKSHIAIFLLAGIVVSCANQVPEPNTNHAGHGPATNAPSSTTTADHNSMTHGDKPGHSHMEGSPGASQAPFELQFLDTMIAHHQGAVEMSLLAPTRAQSGDVKELAANIISDQEREIAKMTEWRNGWFEGKAPAINMEFPGMSHGMGQMDLKKLQGLNGKEFDVEFLKQMIPHHEGAVEMARALKDGSARPELKELAADIIAAQEAEIKQMKDWLARF